MPGQRHKQIKVRIVGRALNWRNVQIPNEDFQVLKNSNQIVVTNRKL